MEYVYFFVGLFILAAIWGWRVRRGGSDDDGDHRTAAQPFGRAKDDGLLHGGVFGRSPFDQVGKRGEITSPQRVSREEGHGKDGGG